MNLRNNNNKKKKKDSEAAANNHSKQRIFQHRKHKLRQFLSCQPLASPPFDPFCTPSRLLPVRFFPSASLLLSSALSHNIANSTHIPVGAVDGRTAIQQRRATSHVALLCGSEEIAHRECQRDPVSCGATE